MDHFDACKHEIDLHAECIDSFFCFVLGFFLLIFPLQLQKAWGIVITLPGGVGGQHMDTHVCRSFKLIL